MHNNSKLLRTAMVALLSMVCLALILKGGVQPVARAALQAPGPNNLFLPIVLNRFPMQTIFGIEIGSIDQAGGLDYVSAAYTTWVRRNAVLWSEVEPSLGTRNWNALAGLENELVNASNAHIQPIVIVRSTPGWARKYQNSACGPIKQEAFGDFGGFMRDLVARYSVPPYNVKYWEIWNEPDVEVMTEDNGFGCWGNPADPYFGGEYYAQMLQAVYPQIKAVDPTAQVLVGGLLLDCNPNLPGACTHSEPPKFLEGILHTDGGASFDGVSFHAYDYYLDALGQYYNSPNWNSYWDTTGPAMIAKANYVQDMLLDHGVTGKFLMNTESALLCQSCSDDPTFETTKAYYVAQVYAASIAQGLRANIWFNVFGWRNSGLLNYDFSPRPAYTAFQFARSELRDASFTREISEFGNTIKGYELNRGGRKIWILWSLDGNAHPISLPAVPLAAWDAMGSAVPIVDPMTVGLNPLYLEMP